MTKDYIKYVHDIDAGLADVFKAAPGPMRAYRQLFEEATKAGALDTKVKELMAVAISISIAPDFMKENKDNDDSKLFILSTIFLIGSLSVEQASAQAAIYTYRTRSVG